ncbi:MAG TPA: PilT/PilU family type 4a pilus ATPase [bacterium]|nr:PilT/PilU family type 4a pilus ATPase [bacterium]
MFLTPFLEELVKRKASDLHLKMGVPPTLRVDGELTMLDVARPTAEQMEQAAAEILTPSQKKEYDETSEVDFAFGVPGLARFRANFYKQRGSTAMVFRLIPFDPPRIEDLALPPAVRELALRHRGLVLVTGTVGSGKSTTLAAMVRVINDNLRRNIITIEDPIEFLHRDNKSLISQREVGSDTDSFPVALRHILRQDPDVILVGEIRDQLTMSIALTAANTGHLVLSTLHTIDAAQAVNRIISFFPPHQHQEVRFLMSTCLEAIISMRLVPRADGQGRVPAVEVMIATGTVKEYLADAGRTHLIKNVIEESTTEYGMQSFDQSLLSWYNKGVITLDDALRFASSPTALQIKAKGIQTGSDATWAPFEMT